MVRLASVLIAVALAFAASSYLLATAIDNGVPVGDMLVMAAAAAIVLSAGAFCLALLAWWKTTVMQAQLRRLGKSIDISLRDFQSRSSRDAATINEMSEAVAQEIQTLSAEREADTVQDPEPTAPPRPPATVVQLVAPRRGRQAIEAGDGDAVERAFHKAVPDGGFELSLQPIVSISRSIAAGFEVFATLATDAGAEVHLRRAPEAAGLVDRTAFEHMLFETAVDAARRRVGAVSETMPLHVAVSDALLGDGGAFSRVVDLVDLYPALTKSIVLSVPAAVATLHHQALGLVQERGVRIAIEGWQEPARAADRPAFGGAAFLKLSANRLLDREKSRRKLLPATILLEAAMADDVTVIATEVATDEDAVSLIDLGIDLMSGARFAGPKRLKGETTRPSERAALP